MILTPHIGGSTEEAQEAIGKEVSTALVKFVNSGATTGAVNFPQVELPMSKGAHRILNVHRNVPGVLRDINKIVSDKAANIRAQLLATDPDIGYLIMDLDHDVSQDVKQGGRRARDQHQDADPVLMRAALVRPAGVRSQRAAVPVRQGEGGPVQWHGDDAPGPGSTREGGQQAPAVFVPRPRRRTRPRGAVRAPALASSCDDPGTHRPLR